MLYTICLCLCVLLYVIGAAAVCYLLLLLAFRPKRKHKSFLLLPMDENEEENAKRLCYAAERINLFGENSNTRILALEADGKDHTQLEKMFEWQNQIRFIHIGDMPCLFSCLWDHSQDI